MSDIYSTFANSLKQGDIQVKAEPKALFGLLSSASSSQSQPQSTRSSLTQDLENTPSANNYLSTSYENFKGRFFSPQSAQPDQSQPAPVRFVISKMNDQKDYTKAFVCFFLSGLFMLLAFLTLPTIILSP